MSQQGVVITQSPFRLSFFGGGTDLPEYFNEHDGIVLATSINKYLYVTINSLKRFYGKKFRLSYSKLEHVDCIEDLQHGIVRETLQNHRFFPKDSYIDMHTYADFPSSCGMGSSSVFTIGFLNALYALNGIYRTPECISYEAIDIERNKLKDFGGWQDQVTSSYGGFNIVKFKNKSFTVEKITISPAKLELLERSCLLFFTGGERSSTVIQQSVMSNFNQQKVDTLNNLKAITLKAIDVIHNDNLTNYQMVEAFGKLLHESWKLKCGLSNKISNNQIDIMYDKALNAGAYGGKLCGAGGQGFLLVVSALEVQEQIITSLSEYQVVRFAFEDAGSKIIYSKLFKDNL